jgi:hypothetical protein
VSRARRLPPAVCLTTSLALAAAGCVGAIGVAPADGGGAGGNGPPGTGGNPGAGGSTTVLAAPPSALPAESACVDNRPGPRLMRRLSSDELAATIKDLFRDPNAPVATIFQDPQILGFDVDADALLIQGIAAQQIKDNAETLANWAVTNHLADLSTCQTQDATCGPTFIRAFGKRAFRAPLSDARVMDYYQSLFAPETSFSNAVEAVVAAMLQSPYFLYRQEIGPLSAPPTANVTLTPYQVASNLSYLLTGSMPDDQLMAAADNNLLSKPSDVDQQVQRLLADPRSADAVMTFMTGWLQLARLQLTDALHQDMLTETRTFVLDTFNHGGLADLLTANYSFLNSNLAQHYGFPTTGLGAAFTKVPYPAGGTMRDPGILAHGSILTGHSTVFQNMPISSPVQRGRLVRVRLLCQNIPPPPQNLDVSLHPAPQPGTTRQHFEQAHAANRDDCTPCHRLMDPIGFGFEHYGPLGQWRDTELVGTTPEPIDSSGTILSAEDAAGNTSDVTFNGISQLESYLASSDAVKHCVVRYWGYYAFGKASWDQDACTWSSIQNEAAASGFSLQSVVKGIIHSPNFSNRVGAP